MFGMIFVSADFGILAFLMGHFARKKHKVEKGKSAFIMGLILMAFILGFIDLIVFSSIFI